MSSQPKAVAPDVDAQRWHPLLIDLHRYWRSIGPAGRLPGRQHFDPMAVPQLLPRILLLDVHRNPFRLRFRLVGTAIGTATKREFTGRWFEDAYGTSPSYAEALDRGRRVVETAVPSWRRGRARLDLDPIFSEVENLILPLARDGRSVDMLLIGVIYYRRDGRPM